MAHGATDLSGYMDASFRALKNGETCLGDNSPKECIILIAIELFL